MRHAPVFVLASLAVLPAFAQEPAPFVSTAGGYQVQFPTAPKEQVNAAQGLRMHVDVAPSADRTASFAVIWGDHFPEARKAVDRVLEGEITALLAADRKLVAQGPVKLGRWTVRGYQLIRGDGRIYHGRLFLRGTRMYHLMVLAPVQTAAPLAERFFNSFMLAGEGIADPPVPPPPALVAFAEAGVSVTLNGEPRKETLPEGQGAMISTRSRGGLRNELLMFTPMRVAPDASQQALDRLVKGFQASVEKLTDLRALQVADRPAREFRTQKGNMEAYVRIILLERGALSLQLSAPVGVLTPKDAAEFFADVRVEAAATAAAAPR